MRNGWIRDIADYAKYGILRRLAGSDLRLVVLWYLNHLPSRQPISAYLSRPEVYEVGDGDLFKGLTRLHAMGYPTVEDVAREGILPPNTLFYDEPLAWESQDGTRHHASRANWFAQAIEASAQAHLVFLDPDTGLEPNGGAGPTHVKNSEARIFWEAISVGDALVFYQHETNKAGRPWIEDKRRQFADAIGVPLNAALVASDPDSPYRLD